MNIASGLCGVLEPWAGEKPYLGTSEGVKTTVTLTLSFLPPFLLPILADEWTSSSSFSSLSLRWSCLLFLISSGLSLHTSVLSLLFILNTVTFLLLLPSLQSPSITPYISPSSVAFSTRHIHYTSWRVFLRPSLLPQSIFLCFFPYLCFPFRFSSITSLTYIRRDFSRERVNDKGGRDET